MREGVDSTRARCEHRLVRSDDHANPLDFVVEANRGGPIEGQRLSISSVICDQVGIRIRYELDPGLPSGSAGFGPQGVGEDNLGTRYEDLGGAFGRPADRPDRTDGVITMPLPAAPAQLLRVHLGWDPPTYEFPFQHPNVDLLVRLA
jgi:hypothetical protein